jgi:transposase
LLAWEATMRRATREEWAARVARWKDSGLTAAAFGAQEGISPGGLTWWKWRLASKESKRALAQRSVKVASKAETARISPLTFVEMTATMHGAALEVVLPSSIRVQVRPGFDGATLGRLLDVLGARR